MALRDRLPFNLPALGASGATDQRQGNVPLLGHSSEAPDPGTIRPRVGAAPFGQSGRANFYGLPQYDELNPKLIGPQGIGRLDQMYWTDAHVRRLVLAGWSPITAGTWTLDPYGGEDATDADRECADAIWWLLTQWMSPNFYEHLYTVGPLLVRSGFAPFEQIWDTVEYQGKTLLGPRRLDVRLPRTIWQWWQDDFGELTHIGQILPNRPAVIIPASELVYYRLAAEGDNWMGMSLLRHAYKHWYIKNNLERLDAIGQERKAVGMPVVYHSPDIEEDMLNGVERALANMHISEVAYLMLPGYKMGQAPDNAVGNQWLVDVIKFDSSSGDSIRQSLDYHQTAIAASFLTDFLELGHHQVGARATAEVQEDPFLTAISGALLPPVIPPLNRLIDRIRKLNWGNLDGSPQLKLTLNDEASLSEIAAYVVPLLQAGAMQADPDLEDWLRDRAAMPVANAQIREQKQAAVQAGLASAAKLAASGETPGEEPPNPDKPPAPAPDAPEADKPNPNPIAGAVKNTGKQLDATTAPVAGGVIVHAADTGRVLMAQRTPDDTDAPEVFGSWEFPGGKLDGGPDSQEDQSPWAGALREFSEETGSQLPDSHRRVGEFDSPDGNFRAFVVEIPQESDLVLGHADPRETATVGWRHPSPLERGTMSERAHHLIPGLIDTLRHDGQRQLDAMAPLAGGVGSASGLQMVPALAAGVCVCPAPKPPLKNGRCTLCNGKRPKRAKAKTLDASAEPSAKWWERLLSEDKLRQAMDGARDHIEATVGPRAVKAAHMLAEQAASGVAMTPPPDPPAQLADALTKHYSDLYQLGAQTVELELAKQRRALGARTLDGPPSTDAGLTGARLARARSRGQHSAQQIVNRIADTLGRAQIQGRATPADLAAAAQQAAAAQLRSEALQSAAATINDGRNDAARASQDVIGAYYTSCLDPSTCDACEQADDGTLLSPDEATVLGPPNPDCAGADRCRCALVWVLSSDPAALSAVT